MLQIIHIIVALLAALTITILSLYQDVDFYEMCIRLVIVIPVFFTLGLFFRSYMLKLFAPLEEANEDGELDDLANNINELLDDNNIGEEIDDDVDKEIDEDYNS